MEVTITARHCSIPDPLRERTARHMRRLERFHVRTTSATVSFEAGHRGRSVEARLAVAGGPPLLAHAAGPTFRTALDRAVDRLERQLKRSRERQRRWRLAARRAPHSPQERVAP